jgi:hypothetical protein
MVVGVVGKVVGVTVMGAVVVGSAAVFGGVVTSPAVTGGSVEAGAAGLAVLVLPQAAPSRLSPPNHGYIHDGAPPSAAFGVHSAPSFQDPVAIIDWRIWGIICLWR